MSTAYPYLLPQGQGEGKKNKGTYGREKEKRGRKKLREDSTRYESLYTNSMLDKLSLHMYTVL